MIKNIHIKNMFGITNAKIDFTLKNILKDSGLEDQVINDKNGNFISLLPTFLSKNATGKTSLIKSLNFALRFINEKTFLKEIRHYELNIAREIMRQNIEYHNNQEINHNYTLSLIKRLFNEISYSGANELSIEINFIDDNFIKLEMSEHNFDIMLKNNRINMIDFLENFHIENIHKKTVTSIRKQIYSQSNNFVKNLKFYQMSSSSIFRDAKPTTSLNDLFLKNITSKYLDDLIYNFGFEAIKILLTKLDKNIKSIKYDINSRNIEIFLRNAGIIPITPNNLSFGTQKVIEILYKSISLFKNGGVMMVDEIENGLHLSLIKLIVSFYIDPQINIASAQLLTTTHNPLIAERNIVIPKNIFMKENGIFKHVGHLSNIARTEDQAKLVKSKNYYDDLFWIESLSEAKSTLSSIAINQIVSSIAKGASSCQRK